MIDEFNHSPSELTMNIVFLVDTSASMDGHKIDELNYFMTEAVNLVEETSRKMEIRIPIRVIEFNSEAEWLFGNAENGVEHIDWIPLQANTCGYTNTSAAIDLVRSIMHRRILGERNLRPTVVLVSDSLGTDPQKTMEAIERLKCSLSIPLNPKKDKVRRISVCVDGTNEDELIAFSSSDIEPASIIGGYYTIKDDLTYYGSLILRTGELGLFGRLLKSCCSHPEAVPVWSEEYGDLAITDIVGDDDEDDWEE